MTRLLRVAPSRPGKEGISIAFAMEFSLLIPSKVLKEAKEFFFYVSTTSNKRSDPVPGLNSN